MSFSIEKAIKLLRKYFLFILAAAIIMAGIAYYYAKRSAVPVYSAYTELYSHTFDLDDFYLSIGRERAFVNTYIELLNTLKFGEWVHGKLPEEYKRLTGPGGIYGSMTISTKKSTEIIVIRTVSTNRDLALVIADTISHEVGNYLNACFGVKSVEIVEKARPSGMSVASYKNNVIIGFMFGALASFFAVFIKDMYDFRIRGVDELTERYNLPVLGIVPTFDSKSVSSKEMKYGYKRKYYRR